jgi:hypothetical protein
MTIRKFVDNSDRFENRVRQREKETAIWNVLAAPTLSSMLNHPGKPGEVIQAMPESIREVLRTLTAKDWNGFFKPWMIREDIWTRIRRGEFSR